MKIEQMSVDGIGTILGGDYQNIDVNGIGRIRGEVKAQRLSVNGLATAHGNLRISEVLDINGMMRLHGSVDAERIVLNGSAHFFRRVQAAFLEGDGRILADREVYATEMRLGIAESGAYIQSLHGDEIEVHLGRSDRSNIHIYLPFSRIKPGSLTCDLIECETLKAEHLVCRTVRCKNARLGEGCRIDTLEYTGELIRGEDCQIRQEIKR